MFRRRVLEVAAAELKLPQRARSRLLDEVAADADALYGHYIAGGDDVVTALRKVEARLSLAEGPAIELRAMYEPLWPRLLRRFAPVRGPVVERLLLCMTIITLFVMGASGMRSIGLMNGSVFAWLALVLAVTCVAGVVAKAFQVLVKRDDSPDRIRAGLDALWLVAVGSLIVSVTGVVVSLWVVLGDAGGAKSPVLVFVRWVQWSSDLLSAGLSTGFAALLVWFVLAGRATAVERSERERMERREPWSVF
jgi:hypothetical protein